MTTAAVPQSICAGDALQDGGNGVRFDVLLGGRRTPAFVVRYGGRVYGYLNQCAHVPMELDWSEGKFFDMTGLYLMCATHGAIYEPDTGRCVGGPCRGASLQPLHVEELADVTEGVPTRVVWWPDDIVQVCGAGA